MSNDETIREPSDEFKRAIVMARTSILECEHCKRVIFNSASDLDYDEEYMAELIGKAQTEPDRYVDLNDYDEVRWGYLNGKQTPVECPCRAARKYEDWIWHNKFLIVDYLKAHVEALRKDVEFEERNVKDLDVEGT